MQSDGPFIFHGPGSGLLNHPADLRPDSEGGIAADPAYLSGASRGRGLLGLGRSVP